MDYESVKDYFDGFLLKKPQGKNLETIFIICNIFSLFSILIVDIIFSISRQNH